MNTVDDELSSDAASSDRSGCSDGASDDDDEAAPRKGNDWTKSTRNKPLRAAVKNRDAIFKEQRTLKDGEYERSGLVS